MVSNEWKNHISTAKLINEDFTTVTLKKEWDEFNPDLVQRPTQIDYQLTRNKSSQGWSEQVGILTKDNEWSQKNNYIVTKTNEKIYLPNYDNRGERFSYQVIAETQIPGYDPGKITKENENEYRILNRQHFEGLKLQIDKVASFDIDKRLTGASFSLSGGHLVKETQLIETQEAGIYALATKDRLMPNQSYTLKENKPPNGYRPDGPWQFRVDEKGQVQQETENFISVVQENGRVTLKIKNDFSKPLHLVAKKLQLDKNLEDGGLVRPLGSEFLVKNQDGLTEFKLDGNEDKINAPNAKVMLYPGSYTIEETKAPRGYKKDDTRYAFSVSESGVFLNEVQQEITTTTRPKKDGFYLWNTNQERLAFAKYNEVNPFTFTLSKRNRLTNQPISGVTFAFGEEEELLRSQKVTTDKTGTINVSDLKLNTPYYFKEVEAPKGYHKLKGAFKLIIQNDSSIKETKMSGVITYDGPEKEQVKTAKVTLGETENKVAAVITNHEIVPLPNTGSTTKIWLFIIGSLVAIFGIVSGIIINMRREKNRMI